MNFLTGSCGGCTRGVLDRRSFMAKATGGQSAQSRRGGMRTRRLELVGVAAIAVAVAGFLTMARGRAADPTPATAAAVLHTAAGDPDLEGIWTDPYQTPLQRPARYASKETFTD